MAFPDTTLADPWAALHATTIDNPQMKANTTDQLNLIVPRVQDSGWTTLTLAGVWTTAGGLTPAYRLVGSCVHLRGQITGGATTSAFGTLPTGYRPAAQTSLLAMGTTTPYGPGAVLVTTTGVMNIYFASGGPTFGLESVSFLVG